MRRCAGIETRAVDSARMPKCRAVIVDPDRVRAAFAATALSALAVLAAVNLVKR
ncbi:MAG TPA: hypothetical protein VGA51_02965 [Casimicrobiaceae bacterium]